MLVPGDLVAARATGEDTAIVDRLEERTAVLARRTPGRTKIMAANVDTIAAVTSLANPPPRLILVDQLLAFAELESMQALVIFTKPDLAERYVVETIGPLYRRIGYDTVIVNPKAGENLDALKAAFAQRHALLAGVSGVGKSSIFRALGGEATVGAVSRHGLGRQTTTTARLYRSEGGFLIDSPGVSEFGLAGTTPGELTHGFREFPPLAAKCRFTDCTHLREPGCAVAAAVAAGEVAASRYESYRYILLGH